MADNLKLTLNKADVEKLIESMDVSPSEYCIWAGKGKEGTIVITTNDGLKLLLVKDYGAVELSDWQFNELYQSSKEVKKYAVIGESALLYKGY